VIAAEGQTLLGWRTVPVDNSCLSQAPDIQASEPVHRQVFIARGKGTPAGDDFERRLFILRKVISNTIYGGIASGEQFYIVSLSSRTIVYKGMFLAYQLGAYFADLRDERFTSSLALVHQRFSTNTFPVLEARPPLPDGRAQWRDQHPARQRQLDGRPAGLGGLRAFRQRHLQALAHFL
jgi:glutamate synthase (NADPH/NADH) large chain